MTKTQIKHEAQRELMSAMMGAFYKMGDNPEEDPRVVEEARRQVNRIEKLFGYKVGSWQP